MQTQQSRPAVESLHRLLFQALLEIRSEGQEQKNKRAYHLADLFHSVVLEMGRAAEGKSSYEDALQTLTDRAHERGLDQWLSRELARSSKGAESN